jgi:hypothetical protein
VLEREAAVPGDVVCVVVGLEDALDLHAAALGLRQIGLDREGRVDDDRATFVLVTDQVGGAAEVVVDELAEQHGPGRYHRVPLAFL